MSVNVIQWHAVCFGAHIFLLFSCFARLAFHRVCRCIWLAQAVCPSLQAFRPSAPPTILPSEIVICKRDDGSDYLLGKGSFGHVSRSHMVLF